VPGRKSQLFKHLGSETGQGGFSFGSEVYGPVVVALDRLVECQSNNGDPLRPVYNLEFPLLIKRSRRYMAGSSAYLMIRLGAVGASPPRLGSSHRIPEILIEDLAILKYHPAKAGRNQAVLVT
jgi:hypothetical protein